MSPITIINRQRHERLSSQAIRQLALATLTAVGHAGLEVNLVFVGDRTMRRINREFRGFDQPTDVLSFPYLDLPSPYEAAQKKQPPIACSEGDRFLGEVIISTPTAHRYAQDRGLTFPNEIKTLIIHGILHLCGYDHETDHGEMIRLERRLRRQLIGHRLDW